MTGDEEVSGSVAVGTGFEAGAAFASLVVAFVVLGPLKRLPKKLLMLFPACESRDGSADVFAGV
jgi:hypothetical protein